MKRNQGSSRSTGRSKPAGNKRASAKRTDKKPFEKGTERPARKSEKTDTPRKRPFEGESFGGRPKEEKTRGDKPFRRDSDDRPEKDVKHRRSSRSFTNDREEKPAYGSSERKPGRSDDKPFSRERRDRSSFSENKPERSRSYGDDKNERPFSRSNESKPGRGTYGDDKKERSSYRSDDRKPGRSDDKPFSREKRDRPSFSESKPERSRPYGDDKNERPFSRSNESKPARSTHGDDKKERSSYRSDERKSGRSDDKPYSREKRERPSFSESKPERARPYGDKKNEGSSFRSERDKPERGARPFSREKRESSFDEVKPKAAGSDDDYFNKNENRKEKFDAKYGRDKKRDTSETPFKRPFDRSRNFEKKTGDTSYSKTYKKKSVKVREDDGTIRLNKFIANTGVCSRREADELIEAGAVSVNGKIITEMGYRIAPTDKVNYGGQTLNREKSVYLLLNKPKDYITTSDDPQKRKTVMSLVQDACKQRIYPVGRLDRNTTGLLLFTNDGEIAKSLTHPKFGIKKIYHVVTDKVVNKGDLMKLTEGMELEDGFAKADEATYVADGADKKEIGIVMHSGKYRIIRRMFEALGYAVIKLDRVYYAGLTKKDLPRGRWRFLTEKEVNMLKMTVGKTV